MRSLLVGPRALLSLGIAGLIGLAACGGTVGPGASQGGTEATHATQAAPGATSGDTGATSNDGGAAGVPTDMCTLLTVDEVAGALSTDPILTSAADPEHVPGCRYSLAADDVALITWAVTDKVDAYWAALVEGRYVVDGIADGAVYSTADRELSIKVGGVVIRMHAIYASDADTTRENLKALARIVVARMGGTAVPPDSQITAPPLVHAATACDLLSKDDVARVLEQGPIAVVNTAGAQFCSFTLEATGEYLVGLYLDRKGGLSAWQSIVGNGTTEQVEGLGNDGAYDAFNKRLDVQVGDQILQVELYAVADDKALALDRALMEIMLGNL